MASCVNDWFSGFYISVNTMVEHTSPSSCDGISSTTSTYRRTPENQVYKLSFQHICHGSLPINATRPIDADCVLMMSVLLIWIQNYGASCEDIAINIFARQKKSQTVERTFGSESVLVSVAGNACNTFYGKVKLRKWISGTFHENYKKTSKAGVYMKWNFVSSCKFCDFLDIVNGSVRIVGCGSNKLWRRKLQWLSIIRFNDFNGVSFEQSWQFT